MALSVPTILHPPWKRETAIFGRTGYSLAPPPSDERCVTNQMAVQGATRGSAFALSIGALAGIDTGRIPLDSDHRSGLAAVDKHTANQRRPADTRQHVPVFHVRSLIGNEPEHRPPLVGLRGQLAPGRAADSRPPRPILWGEVLLSLGVGSRECEFMTRSASDPRLHHPLCPLVAEPVFRVRRNAFAAPAGLYPARS